jgi:hypothetical protein
MLAVTRYGVFGLCRGAQTDHRQMPFLQVTLHRTMFAIRVETQLRQLGLILRISSGWYTHRSYRTLSDLGEVVQLVIILRRGFLGVVYASWSRHG